MPVMCLRLSTLALIATLLLAGCVAPPKVAPPSAPTVTRTPAPLPATPGTPGVDGPVRATRGYAWSVQMDDAGRRLKSGLSGDASVAQTTDARLWVSLPTEQSFAAGRSALRPAATAWLDQVALALRENRRAEVQIVASADAGQRGTGAEALAIDRAASARDWLVARGIAAPRIAVAGLAARSAPAAAALRLDVLFGERGDPR